MSESLKGKKALVTGGSKGIGLAVAQALLTAGAEVCVCSRTGASVLEALEKLRSYVPGGKVVGVEADVSQPDSVDHLFAFIDEELGGLDILINNAGVGIFRPAAELSIDEWQRMIATNLSGAFFCSREALPRMINAGGGSIINISSLAGKNPFAGGAGYNATKFGLNGFSEAMMLDHRKQNVRISYVMPGSVDTEFSPKDAKTDTSWKIAPEDIADVVLLILQMPSRTLVSRVEVRPARPASAS